MVKVKLAGYLSHIIGTKWRDILTGVPLGKAGADIGGFANDDNCHSGPDCGHLFSSNSG